MSEREELISEINAIISSSSYNFITDWRSKSVPEILAFLKTVDDLERLRALRRVVLIFEATVRSRVAMITYLLNPEDTENMWQTIASISAHSEWLSANSYEYGSFVDAIHVLEHDHGIKADNNGCIKTIEAHLAVQKSYEKDPETTVWYYQNTPLVNLVESNCEHVRELISYVSEHGYNCLSEEGFKDYLKQHEALKTGWL